MLYWILKHVRIVPWLFHPMDEIILKEDKTMKKSDLNQNIYLSTGNKKLKETKKDYFLIWNIPAVITCPYRTSLCEKKCYAKKSECLYPQVLPARERNLKETESGYFIHDMVQHIEYHLDKPKNKHRKCYFRIHEAGDFFSSDYMWSWIIIAKYFPKVQFLAYTKSVQFLDKLVSHGIVVPNNLIFRYSVWDDTPKEDLELAKKLNLPIYTAIDKRLLDCTASHGYYKCDCNCQTCKACYTTCSKIACAIH